ncbi:MAG: hypothetical protein LBC31_09325, partial [Treponema sp.]|nr:hypothetical protein [Treponema sp.]
TLKALPIRSCRSLECDLSRELSALGGKPVRGRNGGGFGSSDCKQGCPAHLYYFTDCPLQNRDFIALLFRYRHVEAFSDGDAPAKRAAR